MLPLGPGRRPTGCKTPSPYVSCTAPDEVGPWFTKSSNWTVQQQPFQRWNWNVCNWPWVRLKGTSKLEEQTAQIHVIYKLSSRPPPIPPCPTACTYGCIGVCSLIQWGEFSRMTHQWKKKYKLVYKLGQEKYVWILFAWVPLGTPLPNYTVKGHIRQPCPEKCVVIRCTEASGWRVWSHLKLRLAEVTGEAQKNLE